MGDEILNAVTGLMSVGIVANVASKVIKPIKLKPMKPIKLYPVKYKTYR